MKIHQENLNFQFVERDRHARYKTAWKKGRSSEKRKRNAAYLFEAEIEEKKDGDIGLDDAAIIEAVRRVHPNLGNVCILPTGSND